MTMIEKMAEAMVTAINPDPNKPGSFRWKFGEGMTNMSEESQATYRLFARAALEALREPTPEMIGWGFEAIRMEEKWPTLIGRIYTAMIDTALNGEPRPADPGIPVFKTEKGATERFEKAKPDGS